WQVLSSIRDRHDPEFAGVMSVLRAGGRPIAAHFGMRSNGNLHWWFSAYDKEMSAHLPRHLLLLSLAGAFLAPPVASIDFGKGAAFYKDRFANAATPLIEGMVVANPLAAAVRDSRKLAMQRLRDTPLRKPLERLGDILRGGRG